jgi:hypothetical protein
LIVINLFAGPGAGKSTNAAGLFSLMKRNYFNCELVQEYAKDLTYEERFRDRADQLTVLANQNKRLRRLVRTVDFAITDGALLNSIIYAGPNFYINNFDKMVLDVHDQYNNVNFYLTRTKKYVPIGRDQTEAQAKALDGEIQQMLNEYGIPYTTIVADDTAPQVMMDHIKSMIQKDISA